MGKRIFTLCVLGLLMAATCAWAASTANPRSISVTAVVPDKSMALSSTILSFTDGNPDNNPWTGSTEVTAMNFGTLTDTLSTGASAGIFYSQTGFCVVLVVASYGDPYQITSTCTGLTGTDGTLLGGSSGNCFGLTPTYSSTDLWVSTDPSSTQGSMPSTATLGTAGNAVATNKLIYKSEPSGATDHIIQAYYGISPRTSAGAVPWTGWTGVPLTQKAQTYTGTVTITLGPRT